MTLVATGQDHCRVSAQGGTEPDRPQQPLYDIASSTRASVQNMPSSGAANSLALEDLGSTNSTRINGRRIGDACTATRRPDRRQPPKVDVLLPELDVVGCFRSNPDGAICPASAGRRLVEHGCNRRAPGRITVSTLPITSATRNVDAALATQPCRPRTDRANAGTRSVAHCAAPGQCIFCRTVAQVAPHRRQLPHICGTAAYVATTRCRGRLPTQPRYRGELPC